MSLDADQIVDRRRMRRKLTFWRVVTVLVVDRRDRRRRRCMLARRPHRHRRHARRLDRAGQDRGPDPRQPAAGRGAGAARQVERQGRDRAHRQPGRHHRRLRAALRLAHAAEGNRSRWWSWSTALRPRAAISRRSRPITSSRSRARSSARSACCSSIRTFHELLKTVGVKVEEVKSSPLKAAPNGFEPTSPEARAALEAMVMDSYDWFRSLVARPPQARRRERSTASPTAACSPAGRRSNSS